jgi:hypothetical protein
MTKIVKAVSICSLALLAGFGCGGASATREGGNPFRAVANTKMAGGEIIPAYHDGMVKNAVNGTIQTKLGTTVYNQGGATALPDVTKPFLAGDSASDSNRNIALVNPIAKLSDLTYDYVAFGYNSTFQNAKYYFGGKWVEDPNFTTDEDGNAVSGYDNRTAVEGKNLCPSYTTFTIGSFNYIAFSKTDFEATNVWGAGNQYHSPIFEFDGLLPAGWDLTNSAAIDVISYKANVLVSGGSLDVYVNLDQALTIDQIVTANVTAQDLFGGPATVTINSSDRTAFKPDMEGVYNVGLIANDGYGQTANATLIIHVVDRAVPIITRKASLKLPYSKGVSYAQLVANYVASDNSVGHGGSLGATTFTVGGVSVTESTPYLFTAAQVKTGVAVTVSAKDNSNLIGTLADTIQLTDDVGPVISKTGGGDLADPIGVGLGVFSNFVSAKAAFLAAYIATDAVDGATAVECPDFPTSLSNITVGNMALTITATDKAGNKTSQAVTLNIEAGAAPVFLLSDWLVSCTVDCQLTTDEIKTIISNSIASIDGVAPVSLSVDDANYQEYGARKTGTYEVVFSYVSGVKESANRLAMKFANATKTGTLKIQVSGTDKTQWYDGIVDFFSHFFERLWNWLTFKGWRTNAEVASAINPPDSSSTPADSSTPVVNDSSSTSTTSAGSGN